MLHIDSGKYREIIFTITSASDKDDIPVYKVYICRNLEERTYFITSSEISLIINSIVMLLLESDIFSVELKTGVHGSQP